MAQGDTTTKFLDGNVSLVKKANKADTQQVITVSNLVQEDEFQSLYFTPTKNTNVVVEPPFNPLQLATLVQRNNVLAQCITAMEVNIESSGYTFELLDKEKDKTTGDELNNDTGAKTNLGGLKDDNPGGLPTFQNAKDREVKKAFTQPVPPNAPSAPQAPSAPIPSPQTSTTDSIARGDNPDTEDIEVDPELEMLEHFFNEPFPNMSFTTIRRKLRIDMEATGNGYLEVIRNMADEIIFVRHLEAVMMRLVKLDAPTNVEVSVTRGGKQVKASLPMRERRFCYKVGAHLVFYREFGASRKINRKTGAWIEKDSADNKNIDILGSEILHFTVLKDFRTHYGLPRWINQLPSILGSRKSEEFNLEFFDAGGLPPAIVFVQGGALVGGVKEQLQQYLSGKASSKHRAAIVEVMSTSGSLDSAGTVSVKVERFGCCDSTTEILTGNGWVKFPDWKDEKVATIENGCLVYHDPLQYHVYDYDGDLIHIEGNATEFMVTPNHKVLHTNKYHQDKIDVASKVFNKYEVILPVAPKYGYMKEDSVSFTICEKDINADLFLKFLGMFIADGFTNEANNQICFAVKREHKKLFISSFFTEIASYFSAPARVNDGKPYEGCTHYAFSDADFKTWLRTNVGINSSAKHIPTEFLKINQRQSELLLKALFEGDGHYLGKPDNSKNSWVYSTVSQQLVDDIQILCLNAGYRSVASKSVDKFTVSVTPKTFAHVTKSKCPKWELVSYTGKVYCFTMPTGVFVSRRNGKVCITGNSSTTDSMFQKYDEACGEHIRKSFRLPKMLIGDSSDFNRATAQTAIQSAENQVFQPERFTFDEMINTTIIKALGAKRYKLRSLNMTISDPEMQLNSLKASWNLIDGETFIETANEISGLDMKYSKEAEQANKPPDPMGGMGGSMGGDMGGDPNDPNSPLPDTQSNLGDAPGSYDDGSTNLGTPKPKVGLPDDPNLGSELGQPPPIGAGY